MGVLPARVGLPAATGALALLCACGSQSTAPTPATPTPTPTAAPTPAVSPLPAPTPVPTGPNRPPVGSFRFSPLPRADGGIRIFHGEQVVVNGVRFVDPDGDRLYLTVSWGDALRNHIQCGPCRLVHPYTRPGRFVLSAEITDLRSRPVTASIDVDVE